MKRVTTEGQFGQFVFAAELPVFFSKRVRLREARERMEETDLTKAASPGLPLLRSRGPLIVAGAWPLTRWRWISGRNVLASFFTDSLWTSTQAETRELHSAGAPVGWAARLAVRWVKQ